MIYLDNAATSFPKPPAVCKEVLNCLENYCGNPGRGAHSLSLAAAEKVYECRENAAALLGCEPENIVFTLNTTHALNIVIKGVLRPKDHVLLSDLEHNSVLRPLWRMAQEGIIEYDIYPSLTVESRPPASALICSHISSLIRPNTRMLICCHSSNICSRVLPLREIGALCRRRGILFVVDAAQSAGHLPIDMKKMNIDALCAPGHKGLLGPQGCGILALRSGVLLDTLTEGGNGVNSLEAGMPDFSPERYEAGTLAVPAIAGLSEGIKTITAHGIINIRAHANMLYHTLYDMLSSVRGVTIYAPAHVGAVMLFNVRDIPSDTAARELDRAGICVRSGFHCSPLGHATLKTPADGAIRASFGIYNTQKDIESLWRTVRELAK
ncbi:MAG TPA: aminotransferase class V-fold PLP-dependent enzyme [Clostridiales bacterium]|nr:aminotransferase class V-fold PLP-dependent enzyme [Clostridiales bacterium]